MATAVADSAKVKSAGSGAGSGGVAHKPERLMSLDVFRGMTIAAMILVNNGAGRSYGPLNHAEWHGWTHTDLIFPFFLFIAGVSMSYSFRARLARGDSKRELLTHTFKRGAIIIALGVFLTAFPWFFEWQRWQNLRIPGVLVRIGFCYAIAGLIYLYLSKRQRLVAIGVGLFGYWAAMMLIPVPGGTAGDLSPNNNLAAFVDRAVLGQNHLWQRRPWDPEGLLSSVGAICTVLIGTLVGEWLLFKADWQKKITVLVAGGVFGMIAGWIWGLLFPINKNLWTSSYVVFTAGYAMLLLAACYWVIDIKKWSKGWTMPFLVFGMNSILAFCFSTFLSKNLLIYRTAGANGGATSYYSWIFANWFKPYFSDPRNASLAFAMAHVLVAFAVMWWFYRKRIFIKV